MNIYRTENFGNFELTTSIELDCDKKSEVDFARELLNTATIQHPCEVCDPAKNPACTKECQDVCPECVAADNA